MTNHSTEKSIQIEDQDIENVEVYKYLGQTLKFRGLYKGRRIELGRCCFGILDIRKSYATGEFLNNDIWTRDMVYVQHNIWTTNSNVFK